MKYKIIAVGLIIIAGATVIGCTSDKYDKLYPATTTQAVTCDTANISYANDIVPIVKNNCYSPGNGCHDVAGSSVSNYNFTTYDGIVNVAQVGLLLGDINWASGNNQMPKNGAKLSACDISKFTRWINQGALNN